MKVPTPGGGKLRHVFEDVKREIAIANFVEGPPGSTQCFEVMMHACIFRLEPSVQSVVHVHPRHTVLLSTLDVTLRPMCQEGAELVRRPLPVYPHSRTVGRTTKASKSPS